MTDILQEIKNSDRYHRNLYFYKKFMIFTVIISLIIILAMIFVNKRNSKLQHHKETTTSMFVQATNKDSKKRSDAITKELEHLLLNSNTKIKELAHIELLGHSIKAGNLIEAKNTAKQIMSITEYSDITRAYARLNLIAISVEDSKSQQTNISDNDSNNQASLVEDLFKEFNTTHPFWAIAALYCAVWNYNNGESNTAVQQLEAIISSKYASYNTQSYAKELKQAYESHANS